MTGAEPKCYMCGLPLPHSPGVKAPGLCACETKTPVSKREPELFLVDGSEIVASIDIEDDSMDKVCRPIFINQEVECLYLTIADARRLLSFLTEAIPYLEARLWEH